MKNRISGLSQTDRPVVEQPFSNGNANQTETDYLPCPKEVAKMAYFNYVNEGSPQGRDVQHWLGAETKLKKEHNDTRIHTLHN